MATDDRTPEQGEDKPEQNDASTAQVNETESEQGSPAPEQSAKPSPGKPPKPSRLLAAVVVLLLLLTGGIGAAGWWAWQQWELQSAAWSEQQYQLQERLGTLNGTVDRLQQEQNSKTGTLDNLRETQQSLRDNMANLAGRVNREVRLQETDVQRLEVEYLLRTARHVSLLNRDVAQAEKLLTQADERLAEFDDLAYLPVREALAVDRQRLRELPRPDIDGLYFELSALLAGAGNWRWWPETTSWQSDEADESRSTEDLPWHLSAWHELRALITVRYRNETDAPVRLPPEAFNATRVRFQLALQQAQVALVQRNQTLYTASLQSALDLLKLAGDQIPASEPVREQLARLQETEISPELPRINRGLNALQNLVESPGNNDSEDNGGDSE